MHVVVLSEPRFMGVATARALLARGHEVTLIGAGEPAPWTVLPDGLSRLVADRAALQGVLAEVSPIDAIVDIDAQNGREARELMAALPAGRPPELVAFSGIDVYRAFESLLAGQVTEAVPLREDSALRTPGLGGVELPGGRVDFDHLGLEEAWRAAPELGATLLRVPVVYGPGDERRREWPWIRRVVDGRVRLPMGAAWVGWTMHRAFVRDVGRAAALAVEARAEARGQVLNVGEPDCLPWGALARLVGRLAGGDLELVLVPERELPAHLHPGPYAPQPLVMDTQRIRRLLGYTEARGREEDLGETVRWHLDHPPEMEEVDDLPDYAAEERLLEGLTTVGSA